MVLFFAVVAIFVLFIQLANLRSRLKRAEDILHEAAKRIAALQRLTGLLPPKPGEFSEAQAWSPLAEPVQQESFAEPEPSEPAAAIPMAIVDESPPTIVADLPPVPTEKSDDVPIAVEPATLVEPAFEQVAEPEAQEHRAPEPSLQPSAPLPPPALPRSMASRFEDLFGKKLPIWAGGITLAIAGVLIVKYAIDAGFFGRVFTHGVQIASGVLFGLGLIAAAEFAWRNQDRVRDLRVPQALSGAGIATLYASVLVATNAYQLIGSLAAFVALAAITAAALGLSLRFGAPSALLGLAGGLAAPAMVGAVAPNVPLLAVYLGLTIAGLTGVSRMQRWPWLALAALLGGAGWSLWMVLASNALDVLGSLSIGGFVLMLAIGLPTLAFDGPRGALLRSGSAIVGALQLALLVAYGGFSPLHWGLFALLAAAGQFLARRNRGFAIVPTISLALSGLLLAIWPDPQPFWFALIALSLAAIHALPLLVWLWRTPPALQPSLELCALALAAPVLSKWHFWHLSDATLALIAAGAAALAGTGVALGWRQESRFSDSRFACLTATGAALLAAAAVLVLPHWLAPLGIAVAAAALLFFGKAAADHRIEAIAAAFAAASLPALILTMPALGELPRLLTGAGGDDMAHAAIRWAGLAVLFALFAAKALARELRFVALTLAGGLTYGAMAQLVPGWSLPLAMAAVAAALFALSQRLASKVVEALSAWFGLAGVALLGTTGPDVLAQWTRLFASDEAVGGTALLRWGVLAALFAGLAWRARSPALRLVAHAAAAALAYGLLAQFLAGWSLPIALAAIAASLWLLGERNWTDGVGRLSVLIALATIPLLAISADSAAAEWTRLWGSDAAVSLLSPLRWSGVALLAILFAVRGRGAALQRLGQTGMALIGYGAAAQLVPGPFAMLIPAIGGPAAILLARRFAWTRIEFAAASFAALSLGWAMMPLANWLAAATRSLAGIPMALDPATLAFADVALRLAAPALAFGGASLISRASIPAPARLAGLAVSSIVAAIALHCFYRLAFAALFGTDFVATGLAQRLGWEAMLIGGGWLALRRGLPRLAWGLAVAGTWHVVWYTLLVHNPLWTAQAVGQVPLANLLIPAFALAPLGCKLIGRMWPQRPPATDRAFQLFAMLLVSGFAWASLRQIFHGTLLTDPGVAPLENILRSILILSLAIGFLLWGIRARRHDWRIASLVLMLGAVGKVFLFDASGLEGLLRIGSFVALGFSLIGIGWLYSRQLAKVTEPQDPE